MKKNRTISCTVNERSLKLAHAFLRSNDLLVPSMAAICRLSVEILAAQQETIPEETHEFFELFNHTGRQTVKLKNPVVELKNPVELAPRELWWQTLGCVSEEEGLNYTNFLMQNSLTREQCDYSQWQLSLADPSYLENLKNALERERVEREAFKNLTPEDLNVT